MITAKDLMIGDLVRIKGDIPDDAYWLHDMLPWQTIKVEEILSNGINPDWCDGEINDYIPEDAIEPIPLTAEILEKNFPNPEIVCWYPDNNTYRIIIGDNVALNIKYVHELQHALRLCGIEKEIEL